MGEFSFEFLLSWSLDVWDFSQTFSNTTFECKHKLSFTVSHHLSICSNGCGAKPTFRLYVCYISSYFGSSRKSLSSFVSNRAALDRFIIWIVPFSMPSIRGPRASGSVAQINLTLSNTCLTFEFCKLPTFLDIKGVMAFFADICADIYNCQKRLGLFCEGPFSYFDSWIKVIELKAIQRNQKQLRLKPNSPFHQRNCPSSYSEILHFSSSELWKIKYKSWILNSQKKYFIGVFLKSLPNENEPERWVLLPWKMLWKPVLQPIWGRPFIM